MNERVMEYARVEYSSRGGGNLSGFWNMKLAKEEKKFLFFQRQSEAI